MTTTLFVNGTIRTGIARERPRWVLVENDRIAGVHPSRGAVDEDPHDIGNRTRGDLPASDRVVDMEGGALIPGFCDAHVHLPATGLYELGMDFRGERSAARILAAFRERAALGELLFGGNFEDPLDAPLAGQDLDDAVGPKPALLTRADMHSCVVSSALRDELHLEGLPGVDRDDEHRPTGYLREQAASEAFRWFESRLSETLQTDAIRAAARKAYSRGVTTVHEMFVVEWRGWDSYELFARATEPLALNVLTYLGTDDVGRVQDLGLPRIGGDWFLDGSFGSRTAWMTQPYASPSPSGSSPVGIAYRSDDEVFSFFLAAQRAGLQVGVHAIGDAAIEQCITTWERVAAEAGVLEVRSLGHRIEHFECARDDHMRRAGNLHLRASIQPAFDAYWGGRHGLYARCLGWERASGMNRFRKMVETPGLLVGAGSDSTVTPLDPFLQMKALRLHHLADQRLSGEIALALHTGGAHLLAGADPNRGKITAGSKADLVWLDRDPVAAAPEELPAIEVLGTWVAGRRVWPVHGGEAS